MQRSVDVKAPVSAVDWERVIKNVNEEWEDDMVVRYENLAFVSYQITADADQNKTTTQEV